MGIIGTLRTLERLPDDTYAELVCGVFDTRLPSVIMSVLFLAAGFVVEQTGGDRACTFLIAAGALASVARLTILFLDGAKINRPHISVRAIETIEARFAMSYLLFAAILGMFGATAIARADPSVDMPIVTLLVGYAAGVAAGVASRPWIAVPSIVVAIVPTACVTAGNGDMASATTAFSLLALMTGGIGSTVKRYRTDARKITARRTFSALARHDHLTGLANRLALAERFAEIAHLATPTRGIAVHCLDLDGFKGINDRLGHPAGDAVLIGVAARLRRLARGDDFAARLGGDEFVFVQTSIRDATEVAAMAATIRQALQEPLPHAGGAVTVGATIGFSPVATEHHPPLEAMMLAADRMLIERKHRRRSHPQRGTGSVPAQLRLVI